jgi:predicted outer membrane repeat protein
MKFFYTLSVAVLMVICSGFSNKLQANIIFVDVNATGAQDGSSWPDAFTNFQWGIDAANDGDSVWVAGGSYTPEDEGMSFNMKSGVKIFGGFTNTATLFSERNWVANVVMLVGNQGSVIYNVFIDANATLDGVTVTGGIGSGGGLFNYYSAAVCSNVIFSGNSGGQGGAVFNYYSSSMFINTLFSGNLTDEGGQGGAVFNYYSPTLFINTVFSGNSAGDGQGGALYSYGSAITLTNVTFSGNSATYDGGAIFINNSAATITNCVFWGNTDTYGSSPDIYMAGGTPPTFAFNFTQTAIPGTGNIQGDFSPFVNDASPAGADGIYMTADDGLQLLPCSQPLNNGDDAANTTTTDIAGQPRFFNASTIDKGAYEHQGVQENPTLAINADTIKQMIRPFNVLVATNSCRLIAFMIPNGASPADDSATYKVQVDNSVQSYNGQPYAQRHYDIALKTGGATATARVSLFFTQAEFDAYNIASTINLPTGDGDAAGIASLRIIQFHGTSATGIPGSYSGSTVTIDPADGDIIWNTSFNGWQVSFDVTGFSGFIVTTDAAITLPLNLVSFTGRLVNEKTQLSWKTANEANTSHFEVEKSTDGTSFSFLAKITANGSGDNNYSAIDAQPKPGNNYYRLKSVDKDAKYTYSKSILIKLGSNGKTQLVIYPNPASKQLVVNYDNGNSRAEISIFAPDGTKVLNTVTNGSALTTIDVSKLASGTYLIEYRSGTEILRDKFVKVK